MSDAVLNKIKYSQQACSHQKTRFISHLLNSDLYPCSNTVDLNRNFPDPLVLGKDNLGATGSEQAETLAIMKWTQETSFVAAASMHEVR